MFLVYIIRILKAFLLGKLPKVNKFGYEATIQHDIGGSKGIDSVRVRKFDQIINIATWLYKNADLFLVRKREKF